MEGRCTGSVGEWGGGAGEIGVYLWELAEANCHIETTPFTLLEHRHLWWLVPGQPVKGLQA